MSDHDEIIKIQTKLDVLIKQFDNHLNHHFRYNILAWTIALAAFIGMLIK